ncbi:hypothetical protein JNJ66_02045 [Candidatus Saccharibacteria bacterium]|nr:hypothetical protein [Candidatus Saccharibacteria bacterium]
MSTTIKAHELYWYARRYRLDLALAEIGSVSFKLLNNNDDALKKLGPGRINEWQIAFLAKALILSSNDYRSKPFGDLGLFTLANKYNNLFDALLEKGQEEGAAFSFLYRMAHQQLPFQVGHNTLMARAAILFHDIPKTLKDAPINIDRDIEEYYGMNAEELIVTGFCILCFSGNGYFQGINLSEPKFDNLRTFLNQDKLDRVVSSLTADYSTLRNEIKLHEGTDGLEQYAFNPLRQYPIVRTDRGSLVVPVTRFLLERVTTGIFYNLMDKYKSRSGNAFLTLFGKDIFEKYIGLLLNQQPILGEVIEEFVYGSMNDKTSDWIIIEGEVATLIECKTSGLSLEAKSWGDLELIAKDIERHIAQAIKQMHNLEMNIRQKKRGLERLHHIKHFKYVVLTFDRAYLANSAKTKEIIDLHLSKHGIKTQYEVIAVKEMEEIAPLLTRHKFSDLIDAKQKHSEYCNFDFDVFLSTHLGDKGLRRDQGPLLSQRFNNLTNRVSSYITSKAS